MNQNAGTIRGHAPCGLLRLFLRCPILVYRLRLGWILGHRFLLLTHTGRVSGLTRHTVLEVVSYKRSEQRCVIASGWGEKAQWFRNILANPSVEVTLATRNYQASARRLDTREAEHELRDYASRHSWSFRQLHRSMLGASFHGLDQEFHQLAVQLPLVELQLTPAC